MTISTIFLFFYIYFIIVPCLEAKGFCHLPWVGQWTEVERSVNITQTELGSLGSCVARNNDQYLLVSQTSRGPCHRCLIAFPVHRNVLQYKATQCIFDPSMTLSKCQMYFSGDATLHTLFRKDAPSVPCPLEAPLNFTYQSSNGVCSTRTSSIARCAQWNRLSVTFQACPEIPNEETTVSELECFASWHSLGQHYFAARVGGKRGESHRCFIVDGSRSQGKMGISADSGCQELTHIEAATTTMHFRQDMEIYPQCSFPGYLQEITREDKTKAPLEWESMVIGNKHVLVQGSWISSYKSRNDTVWTCLEHKSSDEGEVFRTYVRKGCQTGFQCIKIHRRKWNLVQLEYGSISRNEFEDCSYIEVEGRDSLVIRDTKEACPIRGRLISPLCAAPLLNAGCDDDTLMRLRTDCKQEEGDPYTCIAHYTKKDNKYIIVRNDETSKVQCMVHISSPISLLRFYDHLSCDEEAVRGALPSLQMNITSSDRCETSLLAGFLYSPSSIDTSNMGFLHLVTFTIVFHLF